MTACAFALPSNHKDGLINILVAPGFLVGLASGRYYSHMAILHSEASLRFDELGTSILNKLTPIVDKEAIPTGFIPDVHPVANVGAEEIIGIPKWTSRIVTGEGEEVGRETADGRYALTGEQYQDFKKLAQAIMRTKSVSAVASLDYVMDRIWEWVERSSSTGVTGPLSEHLERTFASAVRTIEFWVPLYRTFCQVDLRVGDVQFVSLTRQLMERWEQEAIKKVQQLQADDVRRLFTKKRSMMQGSLAAVVKATGVPDKARQFALETAERATAMLRFLAPANWSPKLRSYCTLLGHESLVTSHTLELVDGTLQQYQQSADNGNDMWTVQPELLPGGQMDLITPLDKLAAGKSEFQAQLRDALLIHARNSVAEHPADKLLFVMVALESMLLKNDNEPIQKNIAERMALLVGQSVNERLDIIDNTTKVYSFRSKFVHHGRTDVDSDLVSKFMLNAWTCFCVILGFQDKFASKEALIASLEERKMTG